MDNKKGCHAEALEAWRDGLYARSFECLSMTAHFYKINFDEI